MTVSQPSLLLTPELRAAIRAEFAYVTDADLDTAALLGRGFMMTALRVRNLVVRIPRNDAVVPPALASESALLAALEAAGVPFVPRGARVLRDAAGAELANVSEHIEGVPARGVPLRGAARERLARDLGAFLGALHAFPAARARALGVQASDLWSEVYVPALAFCRPHLGPRTRAWLDERVTDFLATGGTVAVPQTLIHGDISGSHLLLGPERALAGVIDFGDTAVADPALDLAGVLNDWPPAFLEHVLVHYPLEVDADARRRIAFYIAVAPIYSVRYGIAHGDAAELAAGRRKLAARAGRRWCARRRGRSIPRR